MATLKLKRVNIPYVSDKDPEQALCKLEKLLNQFADEYPKEELLFAEAKLTSQYDLHDGIRFTAYATIVAPNVDAKPEKSPFSPLD